MSEEQKAAPDLAYHVSEYANTVEELRHLSRAKEDLEVSILKICGWRRDMREDGEKTWYAPDTDLGTASWTQSSAVDLVLSEMFYISRSKPAENTEHKLSELRTGPGHTVIVTPTQHVPEGRLPPMSLIVASKVRYALELLSCDEKTGMIRDQILARKIEATIRTRDPQSEVTKAAQRRILEIKEQFAKKHVAFTSLERDTLVEEMVELGGP